MPKGDTQMRRVAGLLARATFCAVVLVGLSASAALARSGHDPVSGGDQGQADVLPEDPGFGD